MISIRFGFTGPALCISTACAAGANAIGEGVRMVRRKDGSETPVAYVVAPTRVGNFAYFFGVVWELGRDDPRARNAK